MSRILLTGASGQGNPGDDALVDAFARTLHGHELVVPSPGSVPAPARRVPATAAGVASVLRDVDAVVVAGGTVFKTLHPSVPRGSHSLLLRTALLLAAARARGIPMALVGVGAGELRTRASRVIAARVAEHADLLVLRDEESAAVLAEAGARGPFRIGSDAAWTVLDPPAPAPRRGALVVVSHLVHRRTDRALTLLRSMVDALTDRGLDVTLEPWQAADVELAHRARDAARPGAVEIATPPASLSVSASRAAAHHVVVTARFHGLVAAAAAGTPVLAVAHEPKLAGLSRRLGQPSVSPHATPTVARAAIDDLLGTDAATPGAVAAERAAAEDAMRLLRLVVSGGAEVEVVDRSLLALSDGVPW